ncbi:YgfZ/GcvT domain-containing protein [Smaragdicoccus niigatensis]|uniref:CAF17-like 4Fe-4S cluster assembly/insertion protein YgfZ n=1 Tax=Smaragdicoccus niigatensis TaxID=359359 RepID=UPI000371B74C|nr:folate-binding protein YgfZ [Smaragdicoccus niigatensis]
MAESPLELSKKPGAVLGLPDSPDSTVAWHYGDPLTEQRNALANGAVIDRSNRFLITITGPERLSWLNTISSQLVTGLGNGESAENLILDVNGRVEHHFVLTDIGETVWIDTEGSRGPDLLKYLQRMVFWAKVEVSAAEDYVLLSLVGPVKLPEILHRPYEATKFAGGFIRMMPWPTNPAYDVVIPRANLEDVWRELHLSPAGMWTYEAFRVAALKARLGVDTDEKTIPHEANWIGGVDELGAVHLNKGCYRGQETVARVHNLGKPPRRLVLLHLDGSSDERPATGDAVTAAGRVVGRVGTVVDHFEYGPIALALIKRNVPADTALTIGTTAAAIDADSYHDDDRVQPGRAAIERLRGR